MRAHIRTLHDSIRTEDACVSWARQFILFHGKRHPGEMGEEEVRDFLTHLAVGRDVAASTRDRASVPEAPRKAALTGASRR